MVLDDGFETALILQDGSLVLQDRGLILLDGPLIGLDLRLIGEDGLLIFQNLFLIADDSTFGHIGRIPPVVNCPQRMRIHAALDGRSRQYFISHQLATFASAEDDGHGCVRD